MKLSLLLAMSIAFALSLAYAGAEGSTRNEYDATFAKGKTGEALNAFYQRTLERLHDSKSNVTLDLANRAYVDEKLHIKDAYKAKLKQQLSATFEAVDFGAADAAAKTINNFVSKLTHEKITKLIEASAIDSTSTKLLLVNAVYFKGLWKEPFKREASEQRIFYVNANTEKKVPMMKRQIEAHLGGDEAVDVLRLFYADEATEFVICLPKERHGLSAWLKKLNGEQLLNLHKTTSQREVDVQLPRFKVERSFGLKPTLASLGLKGGFSESADLSGISTTPLHIDDVVHKAFIEVNEEGAEAAAATGVMMVTEALTIPTPFVADHPFLFIIQAHNQPLFIGQYTGSD